MFTQDWFSHNIPTFQFIMSILEEKQAFLEIGCFEGRATCWMLENGLDPDGLMLCIDTFEGSEEHTNLNLDDLFINFQQNTEAVKKPGQFLDLYKDTSVNGLARAITSKYEFDFIYIDGSHTAPDVMTDACMAFPLLKKGGVMLFDDYLWAAVPGLLHRPKMAVDLFVTLFSEQCDLILIGQQVAIRKI